MPFVEGESLRDRLSREKQLPIPDAVRIATEVAGAWTTPTATASSIGTSSRKTSSCTMAGRWSRTSGLRWQPARRVAPG
jgi:hypothetical protein